MTTIMANVVASYRRGSTTARSGSRGSLSERRTSTVEKELSSNKQVGLDAALQKFDMMFTVSAQRLRIITSAFTDALRLGLEKEGQRVAMWPTWIFGWPTGTEKGSYLAIDLGGTNLRVCLVTLNGDGTFHITQSKYRLSDAQKAGEGQALLDFCAECLASFIKDRQDRGEIRSKLAEDVPLGFTFSYPCRQERIDHGELVTWTKGITATGIEKKDVAAMFKRSLEKYSIPANLVSIVCDTCGTLMASAYVDPATKIGVIFGTGCNAAYVERIGNIPKLKHLGFPEDAEMVINMEWGAFDNEHEVLPRTKFDEMIDKNSTKPNEQAFEKMISGHTLGEIFRLSICSLIEQGVIFSDQDTFKFEKPFVFDTSFLSMIESDTTEHLLTITGLFGHFFKLHTTLEERQLFKKLAALIGTRSARLSACGIAAIVNLKGYLANGCGVATDGSLYAQYPSFPDRLHQALVDIFGEQGRNIKTYAAEDGSGVGSGIIAAMTDARKKAGRFPSH